MIVLQHLNSVLVMDQNPQFMFDLWTQLFLCWNATIIVPLVSQILLLS